MIIEIMDNPEHETEIKFEDLEPGTVFEFSGNVGPSKQGPRALKLDNNKYILLTYSDGDDWFTLDKSMLKARKIVKVWGKLVGLKVQL